MQEYMNREEAFEAMLEGKKIRHIFFEDSEYLYIKNGTIYSEEGYNFEEGWEMRKGHYWECGWSVVES